MIEFAAPSSITATPPAIDLVTIPSAGIAEFSDILAETLDAPGVAAAPASYARPLGPASRRLETGKFLPESGLALPGEETALSDGRGELKSGLSEAVAGRSPVLRAAARRAGKVSPVVTAKDETGPTFAPEPARADREAAVDYTAPPHLFGEQRIPVVTLVPPPAASASSEALEAIGGRSQASSHLPVLPTAAIALPFGFTPMEAGLPPPTQTVRPVAADPQPTVEGAVARPPIIPALPEPIDSTPRLTPVATQFFPAMPSAAPGPALRMAPTGLRAKTARSVDPAQPISAVANVAFRVLDEPATAPLAATAPSFVLPVPNQSIAATVPAIMLPAAPESRQDFVALVERLIDSRNALSPQPVNTALAHTEFGEITLRFAHDEHGLSVAMASADPGFAPAVQAAVPLERSERAPLDQPRAQPGPSPHHGAAQDRGANHAAPNRNVRISAPPGLNSDEDARPDKRSGIFA